MSDDLFVVFAVVVAAAACIGVVANQLRQPLIVAFIAVGILAGPAGTGWVTEGDELELLARLGITLLLFLVGLKLDVHLIRSTGPVALATGVGQVAFTSAAGFGLSMALGLDSISALYVAVALTFSSTIIIVKLLSDKRELDQLHGRIAVGFLIVQDIIVVLVMIGLSATGGQSERSLPVELSIAISTGAAFLVTVMVATRYLLPIVLRWAARSQELLGLFAIAWAISLGALADQMGFSMEVGAFIAGVSLASTPYRDSAGARLVGLRDFLLLFFFVELGVHLDFDEAVSQLPLAIVLSLFVLIGNPLIVIAIMSAMRYPVRVSFLAGLTVAQISEFSLILATLGLDLGHIDNSIVTLVTLVGLITIALSTYLILYSHPLYERLAPILKRFERRDLREPAALSEVRYDVILYGLGRFGSSIANAFRETELRLLAIDYDPQAVADTIRSGTDAILGNAEDLDFLESLPIATAEWVVSAVPSTDTNLALLDALVSHGHCGHTAVTTHHEAFNEALIERGADVVLNPFAIAAESMVEVLISAQATAQRVPEAETLVRNEGRPRS